jgi:hydrogenase/urease accessory protein HupE
MRTFWAILTAAILLLATPVSAHRLDEYLQATTIAVEKDHVALRLRLTPGVDVARQVLAGIDTNGDGVISKTEQQAYAAQVLHDLSLTIDGQSSRLRLISSSLPEIEEIKEGMGDIVLAFEANLPPGASRHRLTYENHHRSDVAAYLVNCLLPNDPAISIVGQDRNYDQSSYRLQFAQGEPATPQAPAGASGTQQRLDRSDASPIVVTFFWHGVRHILAGYDHLLFIAALVLGAATLWDLVKVITAFTVAHSITLTLVALNLVHLPEAVVEPLIAASIVFVAVQNIVTPDHSRGWSRLAVAFFFGLFHGLGFAGGLLDVMRQMPKETILLAILGFSLGIEAGNQMVLLPLFGLLDAVGHSQRGAAGRTRLPVAIRRIGSTGVSVAGVYYLCVALTGSS